IAKDGDKPIVWVEARWVGGVRAVVLRAAHDVIGRVYVDRQALVLERLESGVHRRDRLWHLFEPGLAVEQVVCRRKRARRALAGHVKESSRIPVDTPETAVVCDEQGVWHPRCRRKRVLVRVEGYTGSVTRPGGVRRHIGGINAGILRALDVAAIRAVSIAVNIIKFS